MFPTARGRTFASGHLTVAGAVLLIVAWAAGAAFAEPRFLSKQYPRCATCHYSDSGGGLLTPYGRSLSRAELSTFGGQGAGAAAGERAEEGFLFGALSSASPLQLGLDMRPSRVRVGLPSGPTLMDRAFVMNMDLQAAWRQDRWTVYGTVGRSPGSGDAEARPRPGAEAEPHPAGFVSWEHWVAWQASDTVRVRGGRFLPAYGVKFADHTSFTRAHLGLAQRDQIYGVEVSVSTDRTLLQVAAGPGRAQRMIDADDEAAFTSSARFQFDLSSRMVLAASAMHRGAADADPRRTGGGLSWGYAPTAWLTTWTHADIQFQSHLSRLQQSGPGPPLDANRAWIVANETAVEAWRGVWLRVSPQVRWTNRDPRQQIRRMVYGLDLFPRTHWHINLSWYRDHHPQTNLRLRTLLAQLHLYL